MKKDKVILKRILLTRMKYIGDVVLTTPLIRTLRMKFPDSHISYLADSNAITLLQNNPFLSELIPFDFSNNSFSYQAKIYSKMIFGKFDLTIDLFSNPRTALLTFATGASMRIGGDSRGRGLLYTTRIADDGRPKNAIDYHYQSLRPLGIEPSIYKTEVFITDEEKKEAHDRLRAIGTYQEKKTVVLHPGGTWPAKLWGKERFVGLAKKIRAMGNNVVISGGKHDKEVAQFVAQQSNAPQLGDIPIRHVAAVLSISNLLVSNDCGVMHIGAAVNTSTIGIFGPGQENIWFPYSSPHLALRKNVPCHPCHLNVCNRSGYGYMECMNLLSVDEVFHACQERL